MSKHTEGKWELIENEVKIATTSKSICAINRNIQEHNYNAKLIEAAPKMYEALKTLQTAIGYAAENNALHVLGKQDIDLIEDAISNAVGV